MPIQGQPLPRVGKSRNEMYGLHCRVSSNNDIIFIIFFYMQFTHQFCSSWFHYSTRNSIFYSLHEMNGLWRAWYMVNFNIFVIVIITIIIIIINGFQLASSHPPAGIWSALDCGNPFVWQTLVISSRFNLRGVSAGMIFKGYNYFITTGFISFWNRNNKI